MPPNSGGPRRRRAVDLRHAASTSRWPALMLLTIVLGYALLARLGLDADAVAAVSTAVAGIAAAVAAQTSSASARDSRDALGIAMKPTLRTWAGAMMSDPDDIPRGSLVAYVWNPSRWPATRLEVEVWCDGQLRSRESFDRLDPNGRDDDQAMFRLPRLLVRAGMAADSARTGEERVIVRFSDERGLVRWELQEARHYEHAVGPQGVSTGGQWSTSTETRLL